MNNPSLIKTQLQINDVSSDLPQNLSGLLKALSPFQSISNMIGQIIYYKQQIKLLEAQQRRIELEADIIHHRIDSELQLKLKALELHQAEFEKNLTVFSKEFKQSRLERKMLIKSIENMTQALCDQTLSLQEKQLLHTGLMEMSRLLKQIGQDNTVKLSRLLDYAEVKIQHSFQNLVSGE